MDFGAGPMMLFRAGKPTGFLRLRRRGLQVQRGRSLRSLRITFGPEAGRIIFLPFQV